MIIFLGFAIGGLATWLFMKLNQWNKETKDHFAEAGKPIDNNVKEDKNDRKIE